MIQRGGQRQARSEKGQVSAGLEDQVVVDRITRIYSHRPGKIKAVDPAFQIRPFNVVVIAVVRIPAVEVEQAQSTASVKRMGAFIENQTTP